MWNTWLVNWNAVLPAASCSFGVPWLQLPHLAEFSLCSFLPSLCVLFSPSLAPGSPVLCHCCVKPRGFGKAGLPGGAGAFGVQHSPYCQGSAEGPLCAEEQSWHWVDDSRLSLLDMECPLSFSSHCLLWFRDLGFSSQLSRWVSKLKLFVV